MNTHERAVGPETSMKTFPVVSIGMSAGALPVLRRLFREISPTTGMAFIIIHHLRHYPTHLPEILSRLTAMPVALASGGPPLQPNHVYILPSGKDITLEDGFFGLRPRSKLTGFSNVATIFLDSLSRSRHPGVSVILSGIDEDGAAALRNFSAKGGITIVQAPSLAEQPGMPRAAIGTGCADYVLAPDAIAAKLEQIANRFRHPRSTSVAAT